jgi:5-methylcytosine-specific restriction enzyme A
MKTTPEQVGKHIQALREHKKMTLRQLADVIQVNYTALNKIENGAQRLDMDTLAKLVDYFEVKADYFLIANMKLEDSIIEKDSDPKQSYKGAFIKVMNGYLAAKEQPFAKNPLGNLLFSPLMSLDTY